MAKVSIEGFDGVVDAPYIGRATVEVKKAEIKKTEGGKPYLSLTTEIVDAEEQESGLDALGMKITQSMFLPSKDQKDDGKFCALSLVKMKNCFGQEDVELSELDTEDLIGEEGEVYIGINKSNDPKYEDKNEILKFFKRAPKDAGSDGSDW